MSSWKDVVWGNWERHDNTRRDCRVGKLRGRVFRQWDSDDGQIVDKDGTAFTKHHFIDLITPRTVPGAGSGSQVSEGRHSSQQHSSHFQVSSGSSRGANAETRSSYPSLPHPDATVTANPAARFPEFQNLTPVQGSILFATNTTVNAVRGSQSVDSSRHKSRPQTYPDPEPEPSTSRSTDLDSSSLPAGRHTEPRRQNYATSRERNQGSPRGQPRYNREGYTTAEIQIASSRDRDRSRDDHLHEITGQASRLGLGEPDRQSANTRHQVRPEHTPRDFSPRRSRDSVAFDDPRTKSGRDRHTLELGPSKTAFVSKPGADDTDRHKAQSRETRKERPHEDENSSGDSADEDKATGNHERRSSRLDQKNSEPALGVATRKSSYSSDGRNPRHRPNELPYDVPPRALWSPQPRAARHSSAGNEQSRGDGGTSQRGHHRISTSKTPSGRHRKSSASAGTDLQSVPELHTMAFNSRKIVGNSGLSGTGNTELLDPRYTLKPSRFFVLGKVFAMLWHTDDTNATNNQNWSDISEREGPQYSVSKFKTSIYTTVRRMVVVRPSSGHCLCVPIVTNRNQGAMKSGLSPAEVSLYAVIYMAGAPAAALPEEQQRGMKKDPIAVSAAAPDQKLTPMSRLNFAKPYTVEHNVKVMDVGDVEGISLVRLEQYFWNAWQRPKGV